MIGPETTAAPCPALMPVLTFRPRATVWLCCEFQMPALTPVLTFRPRAIVWLWLCSSSVLLVPAFTFVLIFTDVYPFFKNRC
jgi:hypothetical protein